MGMVVLLSNEFLSSQVSANAQSELKLRLNMEQAVQVGVTNHFALQTIENRRDVLNRHIQERWRDYLPNLSVSYDRNKEIVERDVDTITHDIRLTVEQVIYDGGRRGLELDLARLDRILAEENFKVTYNELRLNIQESFLRVLAARGKVDLNYRSYRRGILQYDRVRREYDVGIATRLDVMGVASRVQEIELRLQEARNEHNQSMHDLRQALNFEHNVEIEVEGSLIRDFRLAIPSVDIDFLVARAKSERAEIQENLATIHQLSKEEEIAKRAWIPRLTAGGYVGRRGQELPVREEQWGVFFQVDIPLGSSSGSFSGETGQRRDNTTRFGQSGSELRIYDDPGYRRRLTEARIDLGESKMRQRQLLESVAIDVRRAHDRLLESWESIRIGNSRVYYQMETVRQMHLRHETGEITRREIVFAETELVEAQEDLTDALMDFVIASHELEWASAMDPGFLELYLRSPGRGNTLLIRILQSVDGFPDPVIGEERTDIEDPWPGLEENVEIDDGGFLIDDELEEDPEIEIEEP